VKKHLPFTLNKPECFFVASCKKVRTPLLKRGKAGNTNGKGSLSTVELNVIKKGYILFKKLFSLFSQTSQLKERANCTGHSIVVSIFWAQLL